MVRKGHLINNGLGEVLIYFQKMGSLDYNGREWLKHLIINVVLKL